MSRIFMKKKILLSLHALAALVLTFSFAACEEKKGPLEEAGESVDEAAEEVSDEVDDATTN